MAKPRYTPKQVVEALKETKGLVYLAAKKLGCDPETIHNYAKRHVAVKQAMQTARGEMVDVAEAKLYQAVNNGEQWAVLFSLRTQGKARGYVERTEVQAIPPEQVDATIEHELARLAATREVPASGAVEGDASQPSTQSD